MQVMDNARQMKQPKTWLHILFWIVLYLAWVLVFQKRSFAFSRTATIEFCYLFFIAANYYYNTLFVIPSFLYKRRYIIFILLFAAGIIVTAAARVPLAAFLNAHAFIPGKPQPRLEELFINSLTNIFIWTSLLVAAKLIYDRIRFQQYVDNMEKEKSKTELDFLKAQFNPHFLFNSINSIYGHIDKKNASARNMLLTFSEMLRYQLYECNTDSIPVEKELQYIKNYIVLQQSRKEENLVVKFSIADSVRGFAIAPLLFIAFIENCFKYVGDNEKGESKVEISLQKTGETLFFRAFNTKERERPASIEQGGIGLVNVARRLDLLYPGRYNLAIDNSERSHEVNLQIQLT